MVFTGSLFVAERINLQDTDAHQSLGTNVGRRERRKCFKSSASWESREETIQRFKLMVGKWMVKYDGIWIG